MCKKKVKIYKSEPSGSPWSPSNGKEKQRMDENSATN